MNILKSLKRKKTGKWGWPERVASGYLLFFLFVAFIVPATGLVQHPSKNTNYGPVYQAPFNFSAGSSGSSHTVYWLGTDRVGQDVLTNLIFGARTALLVSLPAMLLATIVGIVLGSIAGFWGNSGLRVHVVSFINGLAVVCASGYYAFYIRQVNWLNAFKTGAGQVGLELGVSFLILLGLSTVGWLLATFFKKIGFRKQITLPVDHIILRIIEIIGAIPRLLLIMCLIAFAKSSLTNVIFLAAFTYWTSIARLVRGELLQVKELSYIEAARVAGMSNTRILFKQALPNALPPVIIAVAFGLGNLITLEATLSYLGIGMPPDEASWGKIIKGILQNFEAWWLVIFPTLALCCTILSLQVMAEFLLKQITPSRQ